MDKQMNPLQMVSRELAEHTEMDRDRIESALTQLLDHLNGRAAAEIDRDPESDEALDTATQYRVFCEIIAMFGTQLIAFEDIEEADLESGGESN